MTDEEGEAEEMTKGWRAAAAASALLIAMSGGGTAFAQKQGGILRMYSLDSPASMSMLEEATVYVQGPMMGVFNNLVMFDQHVTGRGARMGPP
jgi:peptide/nickel transport system substrate-binding protein